MDKLFNTNKDKFIAYYHYKSNKKNLPYIIFLHGLMSNMEGAKAKYIENYCRSLNYSFIKFDNFGHGQSSGKFLNETIGSWLNGLKLVLSKLTDRPAILIGSSMGSWIALLAALKFKTKVKSVICLAPAPDFTEEAIWQKLSPLMQQQMRKQTWLAITGTECNDKKYPISYALIKEGRKHLLLNADSIAINCPVHLIHGMLDKDISYTIANRLFAKLTSKAVVLKLIKDADHKLSRAQDLKVITNSLEELMYL